jgi:hypothetical protein
MRRKRAFDGLPLMPLTSARIIASLMTLASAGCASGVGEPAARDADFDPIAFFKGRTHGDGQLTKLFGAPISISVDSVGRMENGTLILDQTIREGSKPPTVRRWTIRRVSPLQYTGTLTDAVGEVRATVAGPRADIRYTMRHGLLVEQQLAQQSDGRTVLNSLAVHKFGARVATLNETIRRVD